jgi:hypothetical protein
MIINGKLIYNLRYADDTEFLAESHEELQHLITKINTLRNNCWLSKKDLG